MISTFTVNDLISDAKLALKSGAYFSALLLTFAIIAECAYVEYPDEWFDKNANMDEYLRQNFPSHYQNGIYKCSNHDRERFQMWVDDWENGHNLKDTALKAKMEEYVEWNKEVRKSANGLLPRENGELLYQLRCSLFHEASSNIEFQNPKKISDIGNSKIMSHRFVLSIDKNNPFNIHSRGCYTIFESGRSTMEININGLIYHYLYLAELYYARNQDKIFNTIKINDYRGKELNNHENNAYSGHSS